MTILAKGLRIALALIGAALAAVLIAILATAVRTARPIGVQHLLANDPGNPPIPLTLLYPTTSEPGWAWLGTSAVRLATNGVVDGQRLPLIIISHGTGGTSTSHRDTALALAEAGFVVAAPLHPGDNFQDASKVGTPNWIADRARHIARSTSHLLQSWPGHPQLDPTRVGIFGYSAGGTTALVTIGGRPDFGKIASHCAATPEFVCTLLATNAPIQAPPAQPWTHDPRIIAAVIVAPGFGFTFAPDGLATVTAPVQLWAGGADTNVPLATNAEAIRQHLPRGAQFHLEPQAGHFAFLPPCGPLRLLLPPMLCTDPDGFDRANFHKRFNATVVDFLKAELRTTALRADTGLQSAPEKGE